jgi:beta-phosphoglucomutase
MKAALFDLDGTLVDNMRFHFDAWKQMGRELGLTLDDAFIQRELAGKKNEEIIPQLLGPSVTDARIRDIAARKEELYRSLYRGRVVALPGVLAYMTRLKLEGVKVAIASAAPPENRELVLSSLGLGEGLDAVVGGEEAQRGKPWPDIFLLAAARVGVEPRECTVFEDAILGVKAGVAAGCTVIGVTTSESAEALLAAGASRAMSDFQSV